MYPRKSGIEEKVSQEDSGSNNPPERFTKYRERVRSIDAFTAKYLNVSIGLKEQMIKIHGPFNGERGQKMFLMEMGRISIRCFVHRRSELFYSLATPESHSLTIGIVMLIKLFARDVNKRNIRT